MTYAHEQTTEDIEFLLAKKRHMEGVRCYNRGSKYGDQLPHPIRDHSP